MLEDDEVVDRLLAAGAKPGGKPNVLKLPTALIDEYLALAPGRFVMADRRGVRREVGTETPSLFWTGAALFVLDGKGVRPISSVDLYDFARVVDALPVTDGIVGTAIEDAAPADRDFAGLRANPVISLGFTAHGPLRWTALALGVFKATAGHGVPVTVNGEPMAGASAPVSLAGTAAVGTAEILAGIVVNQVLEPGRPCFFNLGFSHVMDMRSGFAVTGGAENCILAATGAALARWFGLPSVSWMCTDSLHVDGQNALEKSLAAATHTAAGVSIIWGVGQVESEKTISPVQAVIDDEIAAAARRFTAGFPVDDASLAVEEVRREGIAGSFLGSEHTLAHFRGTVLEPRHLVRAQRGTDAARTDMLTRAESFVREILSRPPASCVSKEEDRELARIERQYSVRT